MKIRLLRFAVLFGGVFLLLVAQSSALPCPDTCTQSACGTVCEFSGGCYNYNPVMWCAGRQAYCDITCNNQTVHSLPCSDTCYTSGGGGGGGGSPVFAHKLPGGPPPS